MFKALTVVTILLLIQGYDVHASQFNHSYEYIQSILSEHVTNGLVDYTAIKTDSSDVDKFLEQASAVKDEEFANWNEDKQLAFMINLYNMAAIKLVTEHYPVNTINEIDGAFDIKFIDFLGSEISLNNLEHDIMRVDFKDEPRIHFVLVCAAKGCPELISEPYIPDTLEVQLESSTVSFLSDRDKNRPDLDDEKLYLSPLFKWYSEDFDYTHGTVINFIRKYWDLEPAADYSIEYTHYDWTLNDMKYLSEKNGEYAE